MLNKNINNSGLFKKNKNTSARDMLSNMAGIRKPRGILAGSPELMQAVAMPQRQTGQGEIVTGALPGQFGPAPMKQPVQRPQPMNMNEQRMNMAQGPVPGMPNVQTDFNVGGVVRLGTALAPIASRATQLMRPVVSRPNAVDVSKLAGSIPKGTSKVVKKQAVVKDPAKASSFTKLSLIGAGVVADQAVGNVFSEEEYGDQASELNREANDAVASVSGEGSEEAKARALIAQLGGNPEGNVKDELNKLYGAVTDGKKIPVSKKDQIEGSINAIIGGAAMSARGGFSARLAKGLEAGAKARLRLAEAEAGKRASTYTPERLYQQAVDAILRGPPDNIPMKDSGRKDDKGNVIEEVDYAKIQAIGRSLAGMDGLSPAQGGSSIPTTDVSDHEAANAQALKDGKSTYTIGGNEFKVQG